MHLPVSLIDRGTSVSPLHSAVKQRSQLVAKDCFYNRFSSKEEEVVREDPSLKCSKKTVD